MSASVSLAIGLVCILLGGVTMYDGAKKLGAEASLSIGAPDAGFSDGVPFYTGSDAYPDKMVLVESFDSRIFEVIDKKDGTYLIRVYDPSRVRIEMVKTEPVEK